MTGVVHQRASPTTLGVVRAAVFLMWLVVVVPDPLSIYADLPATMFQPVGIFRALPRTVWLHFLEPGVLGAFKAALVVVVVLAAIGVRPYRPIALLAAGLLTIHQGLVRGFTFASHEELSLLVVTYLLVVFPSADGFAWPRRRSPSADQGVYATGLFSMALLLLVPYCGIAAHRLAVGAPDVFTDDTVRSWLASLDSLDRDASGLGLWLLGHPSLITVLTAGFIITTIFELLAPLCLILPRFRRVWMVVIVSFHIVNWFTLNLFFWQNILLILFLLGDTDRVVTRVGDRFRRLHGDAAVPMVVATDERLTCG